MTHFDYLSVLVSIVVALGISEVTIAWARVLQQKPTPKVSWLHGFWSVFSLLLMIQFWWGFWRYRTVENWSFVSLITALTVVITLSLCALMLVPRTTAGRNLDSETTYFDNAPRFFILGGSFILLVTAMDIFILGSPALHIENAFRGTGAIAAFGMAATKGPKMHYGFAILSAALLVGFLATTSMY
ncbi:MAG: hypothetical protein AAFS02_16720 [Pseudomonadota bacterium]